MTEASRVVRQSPSGRRLGALGFARLSLSAVAAYVDGVQRQIPFDTIDDMSEGFGSLVAGGPLGTAGAFRLTSTGIYLMNTFVAVSSVPTLLLVAQALGDGTGVGADETAALSISVGGNARVTSLAGTDGDLATVVRVNGGGGDIQTATTCLIVQVG